MKSILNKWQPHFFLGSNHFRDKMRLDIGLINLIERPQLGEEFTKKHYKGFLLKIEFPSPYIIWLRLRKRLYQIFLSRLYRWLWSHIPFEIASCDITQDRIYANYPEGKTLAEFDNSNKHWIIFTQEK